MRKRRAKYTWFPTLGAVYGTDPGYHTNLSRIALTTPDDNAVPPTPGNGGLVVTSIIPDFTEEASADPSNFGISLRDRVEGQEYLLKRIVGNIFCSVQDNPDAWPAVVVTAGFFVARAFDDNQVETSLQDSEVDPSNVQNITQPWIWRRTWTVGNVASNGYGVARFPPTNADYGTLFGGPGIDSKVSRRIRREQRLWFAVTAAGYNPTSLTDSVAHVDILYDLRILGAMRKAKNVSAF